MIVWLAADASRGEQRSNCSAPADRLPAHPSRAARAAQDGANSQRDQAPPPAPAGSLITQHGIAPLVQQVSPSVVTVRAANGIGSGVVFKPDVVVTYEHVVSGSAPSPSSSPTAPRELRSVSSRLGEAAATIRQDYADGARTRMVPPPDSQPESGKENPPLSEAWVRQEAAGTALLEVRRCPVREMARQFVLETSVTELGIQPGCGIRLDHPTVSRRHAEIRRDGDRFSIRDLGSRNGTYLNRLAVDRADLHNGDEITIGTYRLVFRDATSPHDSARSATQPAAAADPGTTAGPP